MRTRAEPTVVIADDDDALRELLVESLGSLTCHVVECGDGQELLRILEEAAGEDQLPQLVISDQRMPHVRGLDVLAWLDRRELEVPFVLLSAFAAPELRERALQLGALRVFEKPVDLRELRRFVGEQLDSGEVELDE